MYYSKVASNTYHPSTNGQAESVVKICKSAILKPRHNNYKLNIIYKPP